MNLEKFTKTAFVYWGATPTQLTLPNIHAGTFTIGDFLRKTTQDPNDALGKMVGIEDGLIKILSPVEKANDEGFWIPPEERGLEMVEILLPEDELAVASGYSIETLTDILFKHHCHSVYNLPRELFTRELCPKCWHEECDQNACGVGLINVWGSVMPVVMCEEHTKSHGRLMESSPFNNQSQKWNESCKALFESKQ